MSTQNKTPNSSVLELVPIVRDEAYWQENVTDSKWYLLGSGEKRYLSFTSDVSPEEQYDYVHLIKKTENRSFDITRASPRTLILSRAVYKPYVPKE